MLWMGVIVWEVMEEDRGQLWGGSFDTLAAQSGLTQMLEWQFFEGTR